MKKMTLFWISLPLLHLCIGIVGFITYGGAPLYPGDSKGLLQFF